MKSMTADVLQRLMMGRLDAVHSKIIELPRTQDLASVMKCGVLLSSELDLIKEAIEDALRYRLYQLTVYEERDDSFDAYDPEGMDAELTSRLYEWSRARAREGCTQGRGSSSSLFATLAPSNELSLPWRSAMTLEEALEWAEKWGETSDDLSDKEFPSEVAMHILAAEVRRLRSVPPEARPKTSSSSARKLADDIEAGNYDPYVFTEEDSTLIVSALRSLGWIWSLEQPEVSGWRWVETWDENAMTFGIQRFHVGDVLPPNVAAWRYVDPPCAPQPGEPLSKDKT